MIPSDLPPGVSGHEPQIVGYDEIELRCPECDMDTVLTGSDGFFTGDCEHCGVYFEHHQSELLQSDYDEMRIDEIRDERLER